MAALKCPRCGAEYRSEDVNLMLAIAKCGACRGVFNLAGRTATIAAGPATAFPAVERPQVPLPRRFKVDENPTGVAIEWRWASPRYFFQIPFTLFWMGFLAFWYSIAFSSGEVVMMIFPLLHVGVGLFLTHNTLAGLLNATRIAVKGGELHVRSGPIPPTGERRLSRNDLDQLFCEEKAHHGKNTVRYSYTLSAVLRGGKKVVLVKNLDEVGQALYLEDRLERALDLKDRVVQGEVRQKIA